LKSTTTFLVDSEGRVVHTWASAYAPGNSVYLLDDGSLLRPGVLEPKGDFYLGGTAGLIQRLDWDGTVLWEYTLSTAKNRSHHDVAPLPNGDVLVLVWDAWTDAQAEAAGRDTLLFEGKGLWFEQVRQLRPTSATEAEVVWQWNSGDHLVQDRDSEAPNYGVVWESPARIDLNPPGTTQPDWLHLNSVDWDPEHDQIVLSALGFSEFWIIDHAITTEQAAGPEGDLLYRWGNAQTHGPYGGQDQRLHAQHDAHWIPEGLSGARDILVFDNGAPGASGPLSQVQQVVLPQDEQGRFTGFDGRWGPDSAVWTWPEPPTGEISSDQLGSAQRLTNGNTLICEGKHGRLVEVDPDGSIVWEYVNPIVEDEPVAQGETPAMGVGVRLNALFRATRLPADHPGLAGHDLAPGALLEEWAP
jgi:hypothetical protein